MIQGKLKIQLGDKVRDTITGLSGVATCRCLYLNGCDHIGIQGLAKDGKIPPVQWVDEPQVELVENRQVSVSRLRPARPYEDSGNPTKVG